MSKLLNLRMTETSRAQHLVRDGNRLDRDQFIDLTPVQQKAHFKEHGFLWVPDVVPADRIDRLLTDLEAHEPRSSIEYSTEWPPPSAAELITNHKLLTAVRICIGEEVRFFKGVFGQWLNHGEETMKRGRQTLHRDFDNDGEASPCWCNSAVYCLDLKPGSGPFWVVPGSQRLPLSENGKEFEHLSDQALMLCARAGDVALFHCLTVHAGGAMPDHRPRSSFFYSYRPADVRPAANMPPWPDEVVATASDRLRPLLAY